ncbi:MAG: hypothetical protein AB8B80_16760 [Marinicellaceae bacterium]
MSLSPIGIFHTVIGIVALISGFVLLWKDKRISYIPLLGKIYLLSTFITAASSLTIFRHGSFNPAHALAILTLLAVIVGMIIEKTVLFKSWNKYFVNLAYSSTILFHLIPTATEILTRFPRQAPLVQSLNDPLLHKTFLAIFVVFMCLLIVQMRWLKNQK